MSVMYGVTRPIKSALGRWFASRAPKSDSATLGLRNVYIFFSREGGLFALLLLITFIAGINYANNLVLGLCFYLASVWLISFHVTFAHVSGLRVRLLEVTMAAAGEPVWVTLQVQSSSGKPSRQIHFEFEQAAEQANTSAPPCSQAVIAVLQGEQVIRLPVATNRRGKLVLPRLTISTVYPLGIMRAWSYVYFARPAWVYPKPVAFEHQAQHMAATDAATPVIGQYTQGQDDFDRLDDYVAGESLARVSWAHVARGQGMLTKHFADALGHEQRLDYEDMPAMAHEQKLAQLAYGVITLGEAGVPFTLQLPDHDSKTNTIGQGDTFAKACLLRLAKAP